MTANPFAALLAKIGRYSHDCDEPHLVPEPDGKWLDRDEVLAALAAAVPADLTEAGKVLEPLRKLADDMDRHATDEWDESELICKTGDLIRALLARIAAQEAQMKGLDKAVEELITERDEAQEWADKLAHAIGGEAVGEHSNLNNPWQNALDMAETALAAMTKERDELRELEKAAKGLVEVLDQHETKGPLPDVALMFCWLAAQNVRAALRGNTLEKPE